VRALELRKQMRDDGPQAALKAQALAQSHTSLASLYRLMGEAAQGEERYRFRTQVTMLG
jgi:hypothetical protein